MKKLLIVVDYQNDFVSGSLGFPEAEALEPKLHKKVQDYLDAKDDVVYTMDTHGENYLDTQEGKKLPIRIACVVPRGGNCTVAYAISWLTAPSSKRTPSVASTFCTIWRKNATM